jgi:hypothetical protein
MSGNLPPELPPPADRRPGRRRRVLLGGRVSYHDGTQVFDCSIRDLSDGGARITVPSTQVLPTQVYLINLRDRLAYESLVVWKRGGEAGLSFVKTLQVGDLGDSHLGYLKRLWLERAAR